MITSECTVGLEYTGRFGHQGVIVHAPGGRLLVYWTSLNRPACLRRSLRMLNLKSGKEMANAAWQS
jgi:hypothetical protein